MENNNHSPIDTVESMNAALLSLYKSLLPELNELIGRAIKEDQWPVDKISKLFFMQVDEAYIKAEQKVLFVGRETFGWCNYGETDSEDELMDFYNQTTLNGKHYNSPFWWFRAGFSQAMGFYNKAFMKSTLWTNLSKIDVGKKRPSGKHFGHLSQLFMKLLVDEIAIVKPDVVIIMTTDGHYTWHLNNYRWLQNELFKDFQDPCQLVRESILPNKIERLIAEHRLPEHTYQICHPNYLRRQGNYTLRAEELIKTITERIKT
jgi:hypothetical protein